METPIKIISGNHRFILSSGFAFRCYWCKTGGYINNGYNCTECDIWLHNDCANVQLSRKIRHSTHPEHLLMKANPNILKKFWCGVCKTLIYDDRFYLCTMCYGDGFGLHISCAIEPPPLTIKHPQAHEHPLKLFPVSQNTEHLCETCKKNIVSKLAYICFECKVALHVECVNSPEVNHPLHPKHSLKLLTSGAPDYTDNTCLLCGLILEDVLYHCSICNFSVCLVCENIPEPVNVEHFKTHEHILTLLVRQISFTCNGCGLKGNHSPYFCLQCDFMVHRSCIGLPRVININRHNHRICHTQQLSFGDWECKICHHSIKWFYGAYTCSVCNNYVVHSQCATRKDVWDGIELEGVPLETEDIMSFKEEGNNMINHFSHEKHNLKLNKDGTTRGGIIRCEACILPLYSDPVYSCEQCSFNLHEMCAKLPRRKHHMFHNKPFTLHVGDMDSANVRCCSACGELFNGFRYESDNIVLDVRCILTSDLFSTEKHKHPLNYNKQYIGKCDACDESSVRSGAFSCSSCDYNLDFRCASLPKNVKHTCDQHVLYLSCKENVSGKYWCDICEEEMDLNKWFYTCNDCEVALHVKCVLGDLSRLKPGQEFIFRPLIKLVVVPNNHSSRPSCVQCKLRCMGPFLLKWPLEMSVALFCSQDCFHSIWL